MTEFDEYNDEQQYQEFKSGMDAQMENLKRYQGEQTSKAVDVDQRNIFLHALAEVGLDEPTFNQLAAINPQGTRESFIEGVRTHVANVTRLRDPKTGQFIPGKPQPQVPAPSQQQAQADSRAKLDTLHTKAQGNVLSEDDELSVIDALFST